MSGISFVCTGTETNVVRVFALHSTGSFLKKKEKSSNTWFCYGAMFREKIFELLGDKVR